jgi:hypothetical protein
MKSIFTSEQSTNCSNSMNHSIHGFSRLIKAVSVFLLVPLLFLSAQTFGQSANLDQIRNGPLGVYSTTPTADWVNGNAGPSNAHFAEGYSIPYRMRVDGLVGTASTTHTLIIEWDTKHGNGHALDYITHYQNLDNPAGSHSATFGHGPENVVPTLGTSFSGAPALWDIPAPSSTGSEVAGQPTTSRNNLPGRTGNTNINKFASWGATNVVLTYVFEDAPDGTTAQTETRLKIEFKAVDGATALFAWGGHIAAEYDWGTGRGATGVSGSPYHTRLIEIDGKPGNQDRSLKATAVVIPPPTCGISPAQFACPETPSLTFTAAGSSSGSDISYSWTLTNGSTSAGAKISGSATGSSITVVPIGTAFLAGGTFNLSLTVSKTGATPTTCSLSPAGTIVNVIATASANPTTIDITSAAHNTTLTADIGSGSTDGNNANYNYQWIIVTSGTAGSLTNATSRIATYTAATNDPGTIQFKVTATQKSAPNCADDATVSVNVTSGSPCTVSPQSAVCQGTTTTHNGTPSPKPANATYTWSLEAMGGGGTTTSTLASANGGVSMQVNAIESYRIVLTQTYANTALNTACSQDVTVVPTPTVAATYVAPTSCTATTYSLQVTGAAGTATVSTNTYTVTQASQSYSQSKKGNGGTLTFTGLTQGYGYTVTVVTDVAGCSASTDCGGATGLRNTAAGSQVGTVEAFKIALAAPTIAESSTMVRAVPNPFTDKVRFSLKSAVSGTGSLELYNSLGQKVGTVFTGYVQAGVELQKEYNVPASQRNTLLYVFKVGNQKSSGKLLRQ